jgi:hypothetical protein
MNKFYVYAYLREDRYTPYYIGKGCGKDATIRKEKIAIHQKIEIG